MYLLADTWYTQHIVLLVVMLSHHITRDLMLQNDTQVIFNYETQHIEVLPCYYFMSQRTNW